MTFDCRKLAHCGVDVRIADSVVIKHPELVSIDDHVAIDDFCYITTALTIGKFVHIGPMCSIIGGPKGTCVLKDFSGLAAGCRIICSSDDYLGSGLTNPTVPGPYRADMTYSTVTLEKHAVLGTNCVVQPGVVIEEGAAVGSCSLVRQRLEAWQVYVGIPAKPLKKRERDRILALEAKLWADLR